MTDEKPPDRESAPESAHTARPERVLVIVAHPDDADFGAAATLARWVREGTVARLVCCTSGDAGADDARTDPLELARRREEEQRAAAAVVGYEGVDFLHRPDGALENDLALREQLVRVIRQFKPDAVMSMDPTVVIHERGWIQHVDHRMAAMAAVDAVYPASRNALAFPNLVIDEALEPHTVKDLYLFFTDSPNAWVDVSETIDTKIDALRKHVSQIRDPDGFDQRLRDWSADAGARIGVPAAEGFRHVVVG
ncbi:MAG TPA: PIG-L deacetylase family protein [Vicinamibacterales bacterium]|nr:PIG-L deacetylase family protein [Vicinamibacterales bacterium]